MDIPSVESVEMAKEVRKQLTELENKAGFHICKWVSQKPEVIEDIPATDRAAEVDLQKKEFGGSVGCSRRQVFVLFQPTTREIPIDKTERAEENCHYL